MANRIVFFDENENELDFHVNDDGELFMQLGKRDEEGGPYNGWITLSYGDVDKLIDELMEKKEEMAAFFRDTLDDHEDLGDNEKTDEEEDLEKDDSALEAEGSH